MKQTDRNDIGQKGDLSEEPRSDVVSDDELFERYLDTLSGKETKRQALRDVAEAQKEAEDYWRAVHKRGEPIPRNFEYLEKEGGGGLT